MDGIKDFFYDPTDPSKEFDYWLISYRYRLFERLKHGNFFLELGCATGLSTYFLTKYAEKIVVVEIDHKNIQLARTFLESRKVSMSKIKFVEANWLKIDELNLKKEFTDIIWFEGAEYIYFSEFQKMLKKLKEYLLPQGKLHIVVSNYRSLHRRIGFYMGQLSQINEFSQRDVLTGGKKWLGDIYKLWSALKKEYDILEVIPYFLKPLPNHKMLELYKENPKLIEALFEIGKELPDYCAEIYVCATPKEVEKDESNGDS